MSHFDFPAEHATGVRPARGNGARMAWAKNAASPNSDDGTRLDATFINDLAGALRRLIALSGVALAEGNDDVLWAAMQAAVGATAPAAHTHDDRYFTEAEATAALALKVSVEQIIDHLTSTDATKPLSAAQGKVLKDLIDGLGDVIVVADNTERDALTGLDRGDLVHVLDGGAGKWVRHQITAAGNGTWAGATKVVVWTQDQAPSSHAHPIGDVTGLQTALDGKQPLAATLTALAALAATKGNLIAANGSAFQALPVGSNGQVLTADAAEAAGVKWAAAGSAPVSSVFGRTGAVVKQAGDYAAADIANTPAGSIAATTVQAALNELDSEKQAALGYTPYNRAGDVLAGRMGLNGYGFVISSKDDITTRTDSGFWQSGTGTLAEGWPTDSSSWQYMLSLTHSNDTSYFSLQIGGTFFDQDWYIRTTNNNGGMAWSKIWTSSNVASQAEAEAGTENTKGMTPLRVKQAITALGTGKLVSRAYAEYATVATITTSFSWNDNVPQNTQGTEILSASLTLASTSNRVRLRFTGLLNSNVTVALFRSGTANALRSLFLNVDTTRDVVLEHEDAPAATGSVTYSVRVGKLDPSVPDVRINDASSDGSRKGGGTMKCSLVLEEIAP